MNRDKLIEFALQSGFSIDPKTSQIFVIDGDKEIQVTAGIERFFELVWDEAYDDGYCDGQTAAIEKERG